MSRFYNLYYVNATSFRHRFAVTMFIVRESALASAGLNTSSMRMNNSILLTSDLSCDLVRDYIFSRDLRLDSLCFAVCSDSNGMRQVLELYKVIESSLSALILA